MRLSSTRMQPSRHAAEILTAIRNDNQAELNCRLACAAAARRYSTAGPASVEAESFEVLEACVETLQTNGRLAGTQREAVLQILRHLAEREQRGNDYGVSDSMKPSIRSNRCLPSLRT